LFAKAAKRHLSLKSFNLLLRTGSLVKKVTKSCGVHEALVTFSSCSWWSVL